MEEDGYPQAFSSTNRSSSYTSLQGADGVTSGVLGNGVSATFRGKHYGANTQLSAHHSNSSLTGTNLARVQSVSPSPISSPSTPSSTGVSSSTPSPYVGSPSPAIPPKTTKQLRKLNRVHSFLSHKRAGLKKGNAPSSTSNNDGDHTSSKGPQSNKGKENIEETAVDLLTERLHEYHNVVDSEAKRWKACLEAYERGIASLYSESISSYEEGKAVFTKEKHQRRLASLVSLFLSTVMVSSSPTEHHYDPTPSTRPRGDSTASNINNGAGAAGQSSSTASGTGGSSSLSSANAQEGTSSTTSPPLTPSSLQPFSTSACSTQDFDSYVGLLPNSRKLQTNWAEIFYKMFLYKQFYSAQVEFKRRPLMVILGKYIEVIKSSAIGITRLPVNVLISMAQSLLQYLHVHRIDFCNSIVGCNPMEDVIKQSVCLAGSEENENDGSKDPRARSRTSVAPMNSRVDTESRSRRSCQISATPSSIAQLRTRSSSISSNVIPPPTSSLSSSSSSFSAPTSTLSVSGLQTVADFSELIFRWEGMHDLNDIYREILSLAAEFRAHLPATAGSLVLIKVSDIPLPIRSFYEMKSSKESSSRGVPMQSAVKKGEKDAAPAPAGGVASTIGGTATQGGGMGSGSGAAGGGGGKGDEKGDGSQRGSPVDYIFGRIVDSSGNCVSVNIDPLEIQPPIALAPTAIFSVGADRGRTETQLQLMVFSPLRQLYDHVISGIDREIQKVAKLYGVNMMLIQQARVSLTAAVEYLRYLSTFDDAQKDPSSNPRSYESETVAASGRGGSEAMSSMAGLPSRRDMLTNSKISRTAQLMLSKKVDMGSGVDEGPLTLHSLPIQDISQIAEELETISDLIDRNVFAKCSATAEARDSIMNFISGVPLSCFRAGSIETTISQFSQFCTRIKTMVFLNAESLRSCLEDYGSMLTARLLSTVSGRRKGLLCTWWLEYVISNVDKFLEQCGYDEAAVPTNYTSERPADIQSIHVNLNIISSCLDSKNKNVSVLVKRVVEDVYAVVNSFIEDIEEVLTMDWKVLLGVSAEEYEQMNRSLRADVEYLRKMKAMDDDILTKSAACAGEDGIVATEKISMTDVVPIAGLVAGRFHMYEMELLTVVELWNDPHSSRDDSDDSADISKLSPTSTITPTYTPPTGRVTSSLDSEISPRGVQVSFSPTPTYSHNAKSHAAARSNAEEGPASPRSPVYLPHSKRKVPAEPVHPPVNIVSSISTEEICNFEMQNVEVEVEEANRKGSKIAGKKGKKKKENKKEGSQKPQGKASSSSSSGTTTPSSFSVRNAHQSMSVQIGWEDDESFQDGGVRRATESDMLKMIGQAGVINQYDGGDTVVGTGSSSSSGSSSARSSISMSPTSAFNLLNSSTGGFLLESETCRHLHLSLGQSMGFQLEGPLQYPSSSSSTARFYGGAAPNTARPSDGRPSGKGMRLQLRTEKGACMGTGLGLPEYAPTTPGKATPVRSATAGSFSASGSSSSSMKSEGVGLGRRGSEREPSSASAGSECNTPSSLSHISRLSEDTKADGFGSSERECGFTDYMDSIRQDPAFLMLGEGGNGSPGSRERSKRGSKIANKKPKISANKFFGNMFG